ncbi:MAG: tyrosine-type recombinase/integrase [Ferruginibacter sp.]
MGAKLNLNLDKSTGIRPVTVYHSIHYKGSRFRISTGQAIEPKHWDSGINKNPDQDTQSKPDKEKKQIVKRTKANYDVFNALFKKQQNDIERIILNLELAGKPVNKETIVIQLPWTNSIEVKDFKPLSLFQKFIDQHGSDRAARTIKGYNTTLNYLISYELQSTPPLSFKDFNDDFYKRFRDYLSMYDNSFGFYIKNLKTFLNWANDKGYNEFIFFRKWKITNEDGKAHFFLKLDEIQTLSKVELDTRLDKVRDLFLMACYCGLRFSDLVTLKPIHVEDGMITKIAVKTNEFVKIPVIPELQELFNKYWLKNNPLPQITNQKGNEYLKELAKTAKLNRSFNYIQKKNKTSVEKTYQAWEMISWHVARHSFITNCIQLGVPQEVVRRVVGHSSFQTLKKYIQNDDDFNKKEMMKISNKYLNPLKEKTK